MFVVPLWLEFCLFKVIYVMAKCIRTYDWSGTRRCGMFSSDVERDTFHVQFVAHYLGQTVRSVECVVISGVFIAMPHEFNLFLSRLGSFLSGIDIRQINERENVYHDDEPLF